MKFPDKINLLYLFLLILLLHRFLTFDVLPENHLTNYIPFHKKVDIVGKIITSPERLSKKTRMVIKSEALTINGETFPVSGKVRITIYKKEVPFRYGERIKINNIRLRRPRNFKNERAFDYESYLKHKDIYFTGSVNKTNKIELLGKNGGFLLFKLVYQFKEKMLKSLETSLSPGNAAIVKGMVLGERKTLTKRDREYFYRSGTSHLMAVSGLHIGFVSLFSYWIIRKIIGSIMVRFFLEKALSGWSNPVSALLCIVVVIFYMILIGWKSSSVRAGIMVIVYLFAVALSRQKEIYRSIFIAAFIILFWRPLSFWDVGFQLSFMAVLTIVFCHREWEKTRDKKKDIPVKENRIIKSLYTNMAINLFAVLGAFPLVFFYFNRITPYGLFANIVAVPIAAIIIPLAIICMIVFPVFHGPAIIGFKIVSVLTALLTLVIKFFSELPMASLRFATPPLLAVIGFYLYGLFLIKLREKKEVRWLLIIMGPILLFFLFLNSLPLWKHNGDNNLKVTFIDVGQGEAVLIQLPDGKTMLVDGGGVFGDFDIGESVVAPYLWDQGIEKIDYLVPTHSDNDHIEGLFYVLKEMKAGAVWTNSFIPFKTRLINFENLANKKKVPIVDQNILSNSFNIKIEKYHPTKEYTLNNFERKENNFSTVFKLSYGLVSFLFTSDIEKEAEEYLVKKYGHELQATILKVPHHGSKTSSTHSFLNAVKPAVGIISVGALNSYHHPAKQTLERYKKNNIKIFRTDLNGAITITTDGVKYKIDTFMNGDQN